MLSPSPVDGSVWGARTDFPGSIVRINPGSNPSETALSEIYKMPLAPGLGIRGMDIDKQGVVWSSLSSGHLASFDRRKCKVLNGPKATGNHCPEGWSFHQYPGPDFQGL